MPLYACSKCRSVDNTAVGGYWAQQMQACEAGTKHQALCSACDPEIGQWHNKFPRQSADDGSWEPDPRFPPFIRRKTAEAA